MKKRTMPCQNITIESQTFHFGEKLKLNVKDIQGHQTTQMTKSGVENIQLWGNGDIQYIETELGVYTQKEKTNQFDRGSMPVAIVHYYDRTGGGVENKIAYTSIAHLAKDLRTYYRENGNHDIMVYADPKDDLTIQRINNLSLVWAGVRPTIANLAIAVETMGHDLLGV